VVVGEMETEATRAVDRARAKELDANDLARPLE
jgi:hypothetical protein